MGVMYIYQKSQKILLYIMQKMVSWMFMFMMLNLNFLLQQHTWMIIQDFLLIYLLLGHFILTGAMAVKF